MSDRYSVRGIDEALIEYASIFSESLLAADPSSWQVYVDRIGRENLRGVYQGSRLAGGLAFYRMGQWFGGQRLDCAGYSGVAINVADRGDGACATLLRNVLRENFDEGIPIASLYASTQYLYRKVGFEHAGVQTQYSLPMSSVGRGDRSLAAHRFSEPPIDKLNLVAEERARRNNGLVSRNDGLWQRLLHPYDCSGTTTYILGELDGPEGFAIFRSGSRDGGVPQALTSTDVAANTPAALARLMALVRDHRSMCNRFVWYGAPNDPLHFMADEQYFDDIDCMRWLLRIVNVANALTQRGFPPGVNETLHLHIDDPLIPENDGKWILRVEDRQSIVEPGGDGKLAMNVRGLAPLFSGLFSATELVRLNVIQSSDDQQVLAADRVFAGPPPWTVELFLEPPNLHSLDHPRVA